MLIFTRVTVNPVLPIGLTCPELAVAMEFDGGEYQAATLPVIVQVIAPCVCRHTPWLLSRLVTEASIRLCIKLHKLYYDDNFE